MGLSLRHGTTSLRLDKQKHAMLQMLLDYEEREVAVSAPEGGCDGLVATDNGYVCTAHDAVWCNNQRVVYPARVRLLHMWLNTLYVLTDHGKMYASTLPSLEPFSVDPLCTNTEITGAMGIQQHAYVMTRGGVQVIDLKTRTVVASHIIDLPVDVAVIGDKMFCVTADGRLYQEDTLIYNLYTRIRSMGADGKQLLISTASSSVICFSPESMAPTSTEVLPNHKILGEFLIFDGYLYDLSNKMKVCLAKCPRNILRVGNSIYLLERNEIYRLSVA